MRSSTTLEVRSFVDGLGVIGATACALHCIAVPVLLVLGSTEPSAFLRDESFHSRMLWLVVPAALHPFALGCQRHKDRWVLLLGAFGLAGLVLARTVLHDLIGENRRHARLGRVADHGPRAELQALPLGRRQGLTMAVSPTG